MSFMYPPSCPSYMINTLPCSPQLPLSNTLRNLEFVYLKSDFVCLIFSQHLHEKLDVPFSPRHNNPLLGNYGTFPIFTLFVG